MLPTLSQIRQWDTSRLEVAAQRWISTASVWENAFQAVYRSAQAPGGTTWQGAAADSAVARAQADRAKVSQAIDTLNHAATVARTGQAEIAGAQQRAMDAVAKARATGFTVADDLTVSDTRENYTSRADYTARMNQARTLAHGIWTSAGALSDTDKSVANRLTPMSAGLHGLNFREGPLPQRPPFPLDPAPPPKVPEQEYIPKTWGACALRGADPNKQVATFYQGRLQDPKFRWYVIDEGETAVLKCGDDKHGLIHIMNDHGREWEQVGGLFGSWRLTADYAIAAALAYPQSVTYQPERETFLVTRDIYIDGQPGPPIWRVEVAVNLNGEIITAYPRLIK